MSVKSVDRLGRIVIPKEYREKLGFAEGVPVSIKYDRKNDALVLKKAKQICLRCFSETDLTEVKEGTYLCSICLEELYDKK